MCGGGDTGRRAKPSGRQVTEKRYQTQQATLGDFPRSWRRRPAPHTPRTEGPGWLAGEGGRPGGQREAAGGRVPRDRNQYGVCHIYQVL